MEVGNKIKKYIEDRGISQVQLCQKTNIAASKLNLSLNGKRRLSFMEYQVICWALGVGVDEFMEPHPPEKGKNAS